ncbi:hypothetical protein Tco_0907484 [Tanacetum coccineum]|uniref:Uncharacterized protein n=1 Tax=Tanacetum coccineum TaxID=301880 RepID=A0ABQ5CQR3_9ASTR
MLRNHQRNTQNEEIYTRMSAKEAQGLQEVGIVMLAIRVIYSHPRATNQDQNSVIDQGLRSKGASQG